MINEHDRVILTEVVSSHGLAPGDTGVVVHVHGEGKAYEVEFVTLDGNTAAVLELKARQVGCLGSRQ